VHGSTYRVEVRATSHAGLESLAAVAELLVDLTPPEAVSVRNGPTGRSMSCATGDSAPACSWSVVDDDESGIVSLEWALGSSPFLTDLRPFASVPILAAQAVAQDETIPAPDADVTNMYCVVRATNGAGLVTLATSRGVRILPVCSSGEPVFCCEDVD